MTKAPDYSSLLSRLTYHAVYDESILSALQFASENGFAGVQVAVETPHLSLDCLTDRELKEINCFRRDEGLNLSSHGPDNSASLLETNPHLRRGAMDYFGDLFDRAEIAGAGIITFHPGVVPSYGTDTEPRLTLPEADLHVLADAFAENLAEVVEMAGGRFHLCIENYRIDPRLFDVMRGKLDSGALYLCWDIAKTYRKDMTIDEGVEAFFLANLSCVRQVHLHDMDADRSHKVIGNGLIDFRRHLAALARAEVDEYCIEVRPREKALESKRNLEAMLAEWCETRY